MDIMEGEPSNLLDSTALRKTVVEILAEAVPLELKVRELRSRARKEDWEISRTYQVALDRKCEALAKLPETKRATLVKIDKINEYIANIRKWMVDMRLLIEQYVASETPPQPSRKYVTQVTPGDLQGISSRIKGLEHRLSKYCDVSTVSRAYQPVMQSGTQFPVPMEVDSTTRPPTPDEGDWSELEEGEIRESPRRLSSRTRCSDLLYQIHKFRASRDTHSATLNRVDQKSKAILNAASMLHQRLHGVDIPAFSDVALSVIGSEEVATMLQDELSSTCDAERVKAFLLKLNHETDVYGHVWIDLQKTLTLARVGGW